MEKAIRSKKKKIKELSEKFDSMLSCCYQHHGFEVLNEDGFLSIIQKREGKKKNKIIIQYSQMKSLISCMELVKDRYYESQDIKKNIESLKKEINA